MSVEAETIDRAVENPTNMSHLLDRVEGGQAVALCGFRKTNYKRVWGDVDCVVCQAIWRERHA